MYWNENRPNNDAANEACGAKHPEISEKKISIEGRVMKNVGVGDLEEVPEPVEKPRWKLGAPFTSEGVEQLDVALSLKG